MRRKRLGIRYSRRGAKNNDCGHFLQSETPVNSLLEPAVTSHELSRRKVSLRVSRPMHSGFPKRTGPGRRASSTGLLRLRCGGLPRSLSHLCHRALLVAIVVSQEWVVERCCAPSEAAAVPVPASSQGIACPLHRSISAGRSHNCRRRIETLSQG